MIATFTGCQFKLQVSAELLSSILWLCLAYCMHFRGTQKEEMKLSVRTQL